MGLFDDESLAVLFVYSQDDSGHFWIFDGSQYHRFLLKREGLWFIRSQAYLPVYSYGKCLTMNDQLRRALEDEAAKHKLTLPIFDNEMECNRYAVQLQSNQFVFDCTYPGGFFYPEQGNPYPGLPQKS
jgi:hypothetical protein